MQWRNDGGVFVDATLSRMPNYTSLFSPTGVVPGDIDGDGDTDLVLTGTGSILLRNQGGGVFVLAVAQMPLTVPSIFGGALVDIDGDGDRDFVAAQRWHQVPGRHLCYVNNGLGQFTNQSAARLPATTEFYGGGSGMATGDIDGDGDMDLIAPQANGEVSVYRNNGVGSFLDRQSIPLQGITHAPYESSPTLLRLADVDADGALDLLFVNDGGYGRHLLRNDGTGQFIPAPPDSLPQSRTAVTDQAFVDLDADGDLDLTQSTHLFNSLSLRFRAHVLMLNDGRGHFVDIGREAIDQVFDELRCQVAVDFDKDGLPDLVRGVQTSTEGDGFGMLWTERNRGDLTFLSHGRIAYDQTLGVPTVLAAADVDADGWDDLYVGMNTAQHLLLLGQGGGRFQPGGSLPPITTSAKAALFGDFDRDGDVDLITPRSGPSSTQGQTQFWANDGLGNFTEQTTQRLPTLVDEVWCSEAFDLEPADVLAELQRREGLSGLEEFAARKLRNREDDGT